MCDFICIENTKSLIDHIVSKHLSKSATATPTSTIAEDTNNPSLEDIANPHVDTFKQLRKVYEDNNTKTDQGGGGGLLVHGANDVTIMNGNHDGLLMNGRARSMFSKKALEDQVSIIFICKKTLCYSTIKTIWSNSRLSTLCSSCFILLLCSANFVRRTRKSPTLTKMMMTRQRDLTLLHQNKSYQR